MLLPRSNGSEIQSKSRIIFIVPSLFFCIDEIPFKCTHSILTEPRVLVFKSRLAGKEKMEKMGFRQTETLRILKRVLTGSGGTRIPQSRRAHLGEGWSLSTPCGPGAEGRSGTHTGSEVGQPSICFSVLSPAGLGPCVCTNTYRTAATKSILCKVITKHGIIYPAPSTRGMFYERQWLAHNWKPRPPGA